MSALRELLAKFTIGVEGADKLKHAEGKINSFKDSIKDVAKVMATGFALEKIGESFKQFSELGVSIAHTSEQLGISTEALQQFQYAGGQMGVEIDTMNASLAKFQKNAGDAGKAGATTGGAFAELKIDVRDAHGQFKSTNQLMGDVADKIAETGDQFTKQEAAVKIFGKAGKALIPLLNRGREGLAEFNEEFEELGGGISGDAVEGLKKVEEATKKWDVASNSIKSQFVTAFLPAITAGITEITKWGISLSKNQGVMRTIQMAAIGVGLAIAAAGAAAIVPWLPLIGTFAAILLVIDDMRAGIQGHKSVISGLLDKLYGQGTGKSFFANLREEWNQLVGDLKGKTIDDVLDTLVSKFEAAGSRAFKSFVKSFSGQISQVANIASAGVLNPDLVKGYLDRETENESQRGVHGEASRQDFENSSKVFDAQQATENLKAIVDSINRVKSGGEDVSPRDLSAFIRNSTFGATAGGGKTIDPNTSITDLVRNLEFASGARDRKTGKLTSVSQTNQTTVNVYTDSNDPNAIGAAAGKGTNDANQAAYNALNRYGNNK